MSGPASYDPSAWPVPTSSAPSGTRSSRAPRALAWSSGASGSRASDAVRSATRRIGVAPSRASVIPVPRVLVVGLAPAAHGGNRTGRVFTGDRSGDWLFASMFRNGFANQPTSVSRDDALELRDAYVAAAVRCAPPDNRPTPDERDRCLPYLGRELAALVRVRVIVALGAFAYDAVARVLAASGAPLPSPRPKFGHGVEISTSQRDDRRLLSPEPTEHVHGSAHRAHARRGLRAGRSARGSEQRRDFERAVEERDRTEHHTDGDAERPVGRADR